MKKEMKEKNTPINRMAPNKKKSEEPLFRLERRGTSCGRNNFDRKPRKINQFLNMFENEKTLPNVTI
ncbi:MAG: hypothetical protein FWC50_00500 [Planctomycetaceae bacterium]|nr:hypothetical protein [Planctomycetaceae bacterium]